MTEEFKELLNSHIKLAWRDYELYDINTQKVWAKGSFNPASRRMQWKMIIPHEMKWEKPFVDEKSAKEAVQEFIAGTLERAREGTSLFAMNSPRPFSKKKETPEACATK